MKPIKNYEHYKINECGQIYNAKGELIKDFKSQKGYRITQLCKNGKQKTFFILL